MSGPIAPLRGHDQPFISVLIAARNAAETLGLQLEALAAQDFAGSWEVIVADNGSVDATLEVALAYRRRLPNLQVVDASGRRGQSYARNVALAAASGTLIACCDADDRVTKGWLRALVMASESCQLVAGPILAGVGADLAPTSESAPERPPAVLGHLPFAPGGSMAADRKFLVGLGGWDETFVLSGAEDVDLSWRAQLAGATLGYSQDAVVWIRERSGARALFRQQFMRGRSDVLLYMRYRTQGVRRRSGKTVLARWASVARLAPSAISDIDARRRMVRRAALDLGRLFQSARSRTLYW